VTPLDGRVVAVVGGGGYPGVVVDGIVLALSDAGAAVARLGSGASDVARDVDGVVAERGALDGLVYASVHPSTVEPVAFVDVDDARWEAAWEQTMRSTIAVLQAAYPHLRAHGRGRVVVVTPTVSMSGAPGLVPLSVAVEGQRLLAKSAARQWGPDGITVNCVAVAPEVVLGSGVGLAADAVSLAPAALGGPGDPAADLGPVVAWLCSDDAHHVTGATIGADGGVWMAP